MWVFGLQILFILPSLNVSFNVPLEYLEEVPDEWILLVKDMWFPVSSTSWHPGGQSNLASSLEPHPLPRCLPKPSPYSRLAQIPPRLGYPITKTSQQKAIWGSHDIGGLSAQSLTSPDFCSAVSLGHACTPRSPVLLWSGSYDPEFLNSFSVFPFNRAGLHHSHHELLIYQELCLPKQPAVCYCTY